MPRAQQNERSALTLLALLDLQPDREWDRASAPLMGITPIMDWMRQHYGKDYKANSRESVRRRTIHQFVISGIVLRNPDSLGRATNSQDTVYQISHDALALLRSYGKETWAKRLAAHQQALPSLAVRFAREREMERVPIQLSDGTEIRLSPGKHSALIHDIIVEFAPRFAPDGVLLYAGDTGAKLDYFDERGLTALGVSIDHHGKMPDVVIYDAKRNWLLLIESVTSHGPVDGKRHYELMELFAESTAGLVYVTAFPTRAIMARYLTEIAWESEVWVADAPSHLIHFNGVRFLGPYSE
jgi:BsuBI/PstI restriction endonuclease domain/BsuBI/PstI restriction endonuclease HTH domain